MKVLIIGGGIGGMTLALSLYEVGITDIHIFEAANKIKQLGVGINVLPHAARELIELGLKRELEEVAIQYGDLSYYTELGQHVWTEPRGIKAGYKWPQFALHRGELLAIIANAVTQRLGPDRVHCGYRLERYEQSVSGVVAYFHDQPAAICGDVLVGCDGIHSRVRQLQYPDEGPPKWSGLTMFRGVTLLDQPFIGNRMFIIGAHHKKVVIYQISKKAADKEKAVVNWVAELRTSESKVMPQQDWLFEVNKQEVLDHFKKYKFDFLDFPQFIANAQYIFKYPMTDRDPLPTWNFGRVTLLGDAAHPMYPLGSDGASQSILDARTLARELAQESSIESAIAAYDAQRRPATTQIINHLRSGAAPEKCVATVQSRAPNGFKNLNDVISQAELAEISLSYKKASGFDPEFLNNRPSLTFQRQQPKLSLAKL